MTDDLFPDAQAKSPRLLWLERHGLALWKNEAGIYVCELDENNYGADDEKDDAAWDFCRKTGLKHYSQL